MGKKKNEIIMVLGFPGAGKTTHIGDYYSSSDYATIPCNYQGISYFEKNLSSSRTRRIILECNIPTRSGRSEYLNRAKQHGIPVICKWLKSSYYDSMFNVCWRFMADFTRILTTEEIKSEYSGHAH